MYLDGPCFSNVTRVALVPMVTMITMVTLFTVRFANLVQPIRVAQ